MTTFLEGYDRLLKLLYGPQSLEERARELEDVLAYSNKIHGQIETEVRTELDRVRQAIAAQPKKATGQKPYLT